MRGHLLATVGVVSLLLALPCPAVTLYLLDGTTLEATDFRIQGEWMEVAVASIGSTRRVALASVDYRASWLNGLTTRGGAPSGGGVFLAPGKYLEYKSVQIEGERVRLQFDNDAEMIVPLSAVDFRSSILEARGIAVGGLSGGGAAPPPRPTLPSPGAVATSPVSRFPRGARPGGLTPRGLNPRGAPSAEAPPDDSGEELDRPEEPERVPEPEPPPEGGMPPDAFRREMEGQFRGQEGGFASDAPRPGDTLDSSDSGSTRRRITRAEPLNRVEPAYDPGLVPPGPGLNVLLEVTVGSDGTVRNVKVIKSTGIPALDQAAVEAVQQWVYKPAERDGVPYESRRLERLTFRPPGQG